MFKNEQGGGGRSLSVPDCIYRMVFAKVKPSQQIMLQIHWKNLHNSHIREAENGRIPGD